MNRKLWTKHLLYELGILLDGNSLKQELLTYVNKDLDKSLRINYSYSMFKQLGGVRIEIGSMIVLPILLEDMLELLNIFVILNLKNNNFNTIQDIQALKKWAIKNNLEIPQEEFCEGYICNNELVNFSKDHGYGILQFKYRDDKENSFILYRLSFFQGKNRFFMVKRKSF